MSGFSTLSPPAVAGLSIDIVGPGTVRLAGTIAPRDPVPEIGAFLQELHAAAMADKLEAVLVDVSRLTFVNSSSVRIFIDWVTWLLAEPDDARYVLRFVTNPQVTWQRAAFGALLRIAREVVEVQHVD